MSDSPANERRAVKKIVADLLSRSDRQFVAAYANTRSITEAGIRWAEFRGKTYANRDTAASKASRKLSEVRRKIEESGSPELWFEMMGLGSQPSR